MKRRPNALANIRSGLVLPGHSNYKWTVAVSAFVLCVASVAVRADQKADNAFFETHVRPILIQRCYECHSVSAKPVQGNLLLDSPTGWKKGGDTGPVITAGQPEKSKFVTAIRYTDETIQMPPAGKLPEAEIAHLVEWVRRGAPDPRNEPGKVTAAAKPVDVKKSRKHWAFQPVSRRQPPAPKHIELCDNPIDQFVLAKQERSGISLNPRAPFSTLVRRCYLDLTGLPPSPEEMQAALALTSKSGGTAGMDEKAALKKVNDKLLASAQFGERWARHWLDVARFAESHGYEHDYDRPTAFYYRDFVIKAINQDLPYDKFVKWQIAGDEYEPNNHLAMMATGFLAAGVHSTQITKNQVEKERYDELDDMLATVGTSMLGLTLGCARCHDHKFDPIPQRDYYSMLSTFTTTVRSEVGMDLHPQVYAAAKAKYDLQLADVKSKIAAAKEGTPEAVKLAQALGKLQKSAPRMPKVLVATEGLPAVRLHTQGDDFLPKTHFLRRGDPNQKTGEAAQGFLTVLTSSSVGMDRWKQEPPKGWRTSYRRRALAEWLTDQESGAGNLLARVIVNRVWHHHFGKGLVETTSDFGLQGSPPTNPELLDWLAQQLISNHWQLKPIHRLIVNSATYAQSSALDAAKQKADHDNKLLWRWQPRRLEAEAIRDSVLAVAGTLDRTMYGPGTLDENQKRRSIYFTVKRSRLPQALTLFDEPDGVQGVGSRQTTTVSPQALHLMNHPAIRDSAQNLARMVSSIADRSLKQSITEIYQRTLCRAPAKAELEDAMAFVEMQTQSRGIANAESKLQSLADLCQVLFCTSEFVYID